MKSWRHAILSFMYENLAVWAEVENNPLFRESYRKAMWNIRYQLDWKGRP